MSQDWWDENTWQEVKNLSDKNEEAKTTIAFIIGFIVGVFVTVYMGVVVLPDSKTPTYQVIIVAIILGFIAFFLGSILGHIPAALIVKWVTPLHPEHKRYTERNSKEFWEQLELEQAQRLRQASFWTGLSAQQFENELAALYLELGYEVYRIIRIDDEVIHLILNDGVDKIPIQCEARSRPVGVSVVRTFYEAIKSVNAEQGIIVSKSGFTQSARDTATKLSIQLIGVGEILDLANKRERAFPIRPVVYKNIKTIHWGKKLR